MQNSRVSYLNNALDRNLKSCSKEQFFEIIRSERVRQIITDLRSLPAGDKRGKQQRKQRLPAFLFMGYSPTGSRKKTELKPTGLAMIDVDDLVPKNKNDDDDDDDDNRSTRRGASLDEGGKKNDDDDKSKSDGDGRTREPVRGLYEKACKVLGVENILLAHRTPSGNGLRLVMPLPQGMSIEELQMMVAEKLQVPIDTACKDLSRLSYACTEEDIFQISDEIFKNEELRTKTEELRTKTKTNTKTSLIANPESLIANRSSLIANPESLIANCTFPTTYEGMPYSLIVKCLAERLGGAPEHGSRNNFIFSMACYLRYICNDDPKWIAEIMPTFGEDATKVRTTIHSACQRNQSISMPQPLRAALKMAKFQNSDSDSNGKGDNDNDDDNDDRHDEEILPQMPEGLPPCIKVITRNVPEHLKPFVSIAAFAPLMALPRNLNVVYHTNEIREMAHFVLTIGPFSSGKSAQNAVIDCICENMKSHDKESRRKLNEYAMQLRRSGANRTKPDRPEDVSIQYTMPNITSARLMEMQNDLNGAVMYIRMNEADQLENLDDWSTLIRCGYDRIDTGQERCSKDSVNVYVEHLRLNLNVSATLPVAQRMLRNELTNGTLSRFALCCTRLEDDDYNDEEEDDFVFGLYNEAYKSDLQPYITRLEQATGTINCEEAKAFAKQLKAECKRRSLLSANKVYKILARRAVEMAFYRAITLYIAEGSQWTKEIEDYVRWSLDYDIFLKLYYFGEMMRQQLAENAGMKRYKETNLLNKLPEVFNLESVQTLLPDNPRKSIQDLLRQWKKREYISYNDDGTYRKL